MRALVLAALLVLGPAFTGCLSQDDIGNLYDDLEVEDKFESRVLLSERTPFSPAGALEPTVPNDTDEVGQSWTESFFVPNNTRRISVVFDVAFSTQEAPLPGTVPEGDARVHVESPDGSENRSRTFTKTADVRFGFNQPDEGDWTAGFEARGNGSVAVKVTGIVPVNSTPR